MNDNRNQLYSFLLISSIFFLLLINFCQAQSGKVTLSKTGKVQRGQKAPPYPGKIMSEEAKRAHNASCAMRAPGAETAGPARALASKGTIKAMAVRCQFPEETNSRINGNGRATKTVEEVRALAKQFTDYFKAASYSNLTVAVDVSDNIYEAPQKMSYYGGSGEDGFTLKQLLRDVVAASELSDARGQTDPARYIDYAKYDAVILVHAGVGQESDVGNGGSGDTPDDIWSVAFTDAMIGLSNGTRLDHALIAPESAVQDGNNENSPLGVMCHEFGHILGLPDLYDVDNTSLGAGGWDLMGYGAWRNKGRNPCGFSSWTLIQLGYLAPSEVLADNAGIDLKCLADAPQALKVYAVSKAASPSEYFLVENREKKGVDEYLENGVLIWHIDDEKGSISGNNINYDETHKRVDLEVAEGLDAYGKDRLDYNLKGSKAVLQTDAFYSGYKTAFNAYTNPSSLSYNGKDAPVSIEVLTAQGDTMRVSVKTTTPEPPKMVDISKAYFYPNPAGARGGKFYYFVNFAPSEATLKIYDRGRNRIVSRDIAVRFGANEYNWDLSDDDARSVANGTYLYRITASGAAGTAEKTGKIVVLR